MTIAFKPLIFGSSARITNISSKADGNISNILGSAVVRNPSSIRNLSLYLTLFVFDFSFGDMFSLNHFKIISVSSRVEDTV